MSEFIARNMDKPEVSLILNDGQGTLANCSHTKEHYASTCTLNLTVGGPFVDITFFNQGQTRATLASITGSNLHYIEYTRDDLKQNP